MRTADTTSGAVEAAVGGFRGSTADLMVPLLLYKSVFLGEWFSAVTRREPDETVRDALVHVHQGTLAEAIDLVGVMRRWEAEVADLEREETLARDLQRRALFDLVALKEGSTEAILHVAMRAPSDATRRALVRLADLDRVHADALRALLAAASARELAIRPPRPEADRPAGAHAERERPGASLAANIHASMRRIQDAGTSLARIVLSAEAYRHLRDEGEIAPDGSAFDLPIEVDFGWMGECFALTTEERVRVAELLTEDTTRAHDARDR